MHFLQATLLGFVEGFTEFLPVSSTGHLMLASQAMGLAPSEFLKTFEIAIQSGAILAVLVLYGQVLLVSGHALRKVCLAFLPTAALGFLLHGFVKRVLLNDLRLVAVSLIAGGALLIIFERFHKEKKESSGEAISDIPARTAVLIGIFQSLAMIPGVSRSAASILAGMMLGLRRKMAVEFSFLLAIPTLLAATALDLLKTSHRFLPSDWHLLGIGTLVSFLVALFSMKFLLRFIQKNDFTAFGIYRIAAGILILGWFL